ncbi:MAG: MFS transporter [Flavobacteriales bacterium AspAUS03]
MAFLLPFFNQLSMVNFALYYAPEILEIAGLATKNSFYSSIYIGLSNLVPTLIGVCI